MPRFVPAASMRLVVGTATGGLLWAARRKIIWRYYAQSREIPEQSDGVRRVFAKNNIFVTEGIISLDILK